MSVDLYLGIDPWGNYPEKLHLYTILLVGQDYERFDQLRAVAVPLDKPVMIYSSEGLESNRTEDDHGDPLTFVLPGQLLRIWGEPDDYWRDKATLAFINELPADWPIVLLWS